MVASPSTFTGRETRIVVIVFLAALGFNLWGATVGWTNPILGFRQTQTAISALFIERDADFSLAYPTPVLGPPWSVPMEFPLYQWAVVAVSKVTGATLTSSGRAVSLLCFYLGLPAVVVVLRRLGVSVRQALIILSVVLVCPLYIHYSREFLIETMALMFSLWYLAGLVSTRSLNNFGWISVAVVAGTGAAVVKVTTFLVFLLPALAWSIWLLWRSRPQDPERFSRPLGKVLGRLAAIHCIPFGAAIAWVRFSDHIKSLNLSGAALQSEQLRAWNFGGDRGLGSDLWLKNTATLASVIVHPWALGATLLIAALFARRWWAAIAGCAAIYVGALAIFPQLYAIHPYYHVAAAVFVCVALGFALVGMLENSRMPRVIAFSAWAGVLTLQGATFLQGFHERQHVRIDAGSGLTKALKALTAPEEVIVVAGDDWSSVIPFFSERRALMIRNGLENDRGYLNEAFSLLRDHDVGALVLIDEQLDNESLQQLASTYFDLDTQPYLAWNDQGRRGAVYLNRQLYPHAREVFSQGGFHRIKVVAPSDAHAQPLAGRVLAFDQMLARHHVQLFQDIVPSPARFYSTFGPELWTREDPSRTLLSTHPETRFWFTLAPGLHRLSTTLEVLPAAYEGLPVHEASDGVEVVAAAVFPDGRRDVLHRRYVNPRDNPADRGPQPIDWSFDLPAGAELEVCINAGPHSNGARDWNGLHALRID